MSFGKLLLPVGGKPYFGQRPTLVHEQMHVEHGVGAEAHRSPVLPLFLGFSLFPLSCRRSRGRSWGTRGERVSRGCEAPRENVRQGLGESQSCGLELAEQTAAEEEYTCRHKERCHGRQTDCEGLVGGHKEWGLGRDGAAMKGGR